jgi:hypothetical protein
MEARAGMRKFIILIFLGSILIPFGLAGGIAWHTNKMRAASEELLYQQVIEMVRTTQDTESIRKLLIAHLQSEQTADKSDLGILKNLTTLLLCVGVLNLGLLLIFLDKKKKSNGQPDSLR